MTYHDNTHMKKRLELNKKEKWNNKTKYKCFTYKQNAENDLTHHKQIKCTAWKLN